jgi:hypothetical protein
LILSIGRLEVALALTGAHALRLYVESAQRLCEEAASAWSTPVEEPDGRAWGAGAAFWQDSALLLNDFMADLAGVARVSPVAFLSVLDQLRDPAASAVADERKRAALGLGVESAAIPGLPRAAERRGPAAKHFMHY